MAGLLDYLFDPSTYGGNGGLLASLTPSTTAISPSQGFPQQDQPQASPMQVGNVQMPRIGDAAQFDPGQVNIPQNAQPVQGQMPQAMPPQQDSSPSFFDRIGSMARPDSIVGRVFGGGSNQTAQFLVSKGIDPALARSIASNPMTLRAVLPKLIGAGAGGTKYGLNPIYGTDEKGNRVLGVLGEDGSFKKVDTGGVTPQSGVEKIDAGDHFELRDRKNGQVVGIVQKNIANAAAQKQIGEAAGKATAAAPADIQAGENALDIVDKIRKSPNLERGTGASSMFNVIPGTSGKDFQNVVDQAKSGAFLQAIQQLRGLGSLSNAEGSTATSAVNRMDTATSKEAFLDALSDYEKVIKQGIARAKSRLPAGQKAQPAPVAQNDPLGLR